MKNADHILESLRSKGFRITETRKELIRILCESQLAANILKKCGMEARSVKDGLIEWSQQSLPRWRPETCVAFEKISTPSNHAQLHNSYPLKITIFQAKTCLKG
jgi:hypothetical protein